MKMIRRPVLCLALMSLATVTCAENLTLLCHFDWTDEAGAPLSRDKGGLDADYAFGDPLGHVVGEGATPTIAPTARGKLGGAVSIGENYDGGNRDLVYASRGNFDATRGTIMFWIRLTDGPTGAKGSRMLFSCGGWPDNVVRLHLRPDGFLRGEIIDSAEVGHHMGTSIADWRADQWHHVCFAWDAERGHAQLYIDGRRRAQTEPGAGWEIRTHPTLYIGGNMWGDSANRSINGDIDELAVFDGAVAPILARINTPTIAISSADAAAPKQTWRHEATRARCCLNGEWDFRTTTPERIETLPRGEAWEDANIIVPSGWDCSEFDYPQRWRSTGAAWYRRMFSIPKTLTEGHAQITFEAVCFDARVYVNRKLVGRHRNAFTPFTVDISGAVKPGENELLVGVIGRHAARVDGKYIAPISEAHWDGIWQHVWLEATPKVRIEDLFIITSTRRMEKTIRATLVNDTDEDCAVQLFASASRWRQDSGWPDDLSMEWVPRDDAPIPAHGRREIEITEPAESHELWSPADPALYVQFLGIRGEGIRDTVAERYGFREFWIDGHKFMLNGKRINIRGDSFNRMPSMSMFRREYVELYLRTMKSANINLVRPHTAPFPRVFYEVADELGMLMMDEGMMNKDYAYEQRDLFFQHFEEWVRRDRNYPSIVLWSAENECNMREDPAEAEYLGEYREIIDRLDGTRPVLYEGDADQVGHADILDYHYPHGVGHRDQYPETAYWLLDHPEQTWYKTKWDRSKPLTIGEFYQMWNGKPEYWTFYFGDRVYQRIFDTDAPLWQAIGETIGMAIEGYRAAEVALIKPWSPGCHGFRWFRMNHVFPEWEDLTEPEFHPHRAAGEYSYTMNPFDPEQDHKQPRPVIKRISRAYQPVHVVIRQQHPCYYSGETLERTVYGFNDTEEQIELNLGCVIGMEKVGGEDFVLEPGEKAQWRIEAKLPEVTGRKYDEGATLLVSRQIAHEGLITETQALRIFPPQAEMLQPVHEGITLFAGLSTKERELFAKLFPSNQPATRESMGEPTDDALLVVGAGFLDERPELWASLALWIRGGGIALVQPQSRVGPEMPVRPVVEKRAGNYAFLNPSLQDYLALQDIHLRQWRGEHPGRVFGSCFRKPLRGGFAPILNAGGPDGFNYSPVAMIRDNGVAVLSQIDFAEACPLNPGATALVTRLWDVAREYAAPGRDVRLIAGEDSSLRQWLGMARVRFSEGAEGVAPGDLLVFDGSAPAKMPLETLKAVRAGATLYIHALTPESVELLPPELAAGIHLRPTKLLHPQLETQWLQSLPFLSWDNDMLWWYPWEGRIVEHVLDLPEGAKGLVREPERTSKLSTTPYFPEHLNRWANRSVAIEEPGWAVAMIEHGMGRVVIDQVRWDVNALELRKAHRLGCAMMTSLGAEMLRAPLLGETMQIDLAPCCNVGLSDERADDEKGGWTDQGANDLRALKPGLQTLAGVPFRIVDPRENDGKAALILGSPERTYFPQRIDGIAVNAKARTLHFLHGAAWWTDTGDVVAKYVIHYADGETREAPVRYNVDVRDWHHAHGDLVRADLAWTGGNPEQDHIGLYAMPWANPRPAVAIESIDFVSGGKRPVVGLLAVTIEGT